MEDELLRWMYHRLIASASVRTVRRGKFSDGVIALIYLLAVLRDRSPRWAACQCNWPLWLRRVMPVPSYSQLMRRLRSDSVLRLIDQIGAECRARLPRSGLKFCDGKPLVVSGFTKDPDARSGHVPDGWAKGYKLHLIVDSLGAIEAFTLTPLNAAESTVAAEMTRRLDLRDTLIRADGNYDTNRLYAAIADRGGRLLAPRRRPGGGFGNHPQHPHRLRAIAELEADSGAVKAHRHQQIYIEQRLAHLTNLPFGLSPLPNFVRRLRRVSLWVRGKIALYHLHLSLRRTQAEVA
jgi:hypothetical protein